MRLGWDHWNFLMVVKCRETMTQISNTQSHQMGFWLGLKGWGNREKACEKDSILNFIDATVQFNYVDSYVDDYCGKFFMTSFVQKLTEKQSERLTTTLQLSFFFLLIVLQVPIACPSESQHCQQSISIYTWNLRLGILCSYLTRNYGRAILTWYLQSSCSLPRTVLITNFNGLRDDS